MDKDVKFKLPSHGNLQKWADQGVLMLNTCLTVEAHKANSHQKQGWETFTQAIINQLNKEYSGIVFLLWGKPAQARGAGINKSKHCVMINVHPSPLSAHRGFFGCQHFSKANAYLEKNGRDPITWQV